MIQSLENISRKGKDPFEIDVNKEMMTLTFKIIESLFGKLLGEKSSVIQKSLGKATDITIKNYDRCFSTLFLPTPDNLTMSELTKNSKKLLSNYG